MEGIGTALGDQRDLASGGASLVGVTANGGYAKLLDGVECGANSTLESRAASLLVIVNAIESDVGLVATATIECAVAECPRCRRRWSPRT
jgi:hypothetical protein